MRIDAAAFILVFSVSLGALAADWKFHYQPADVGYATYGNSLGDPTPPAKDNRKIAFEIKGRAAREIFEAIGPDRIDACTDSPSLRLRARDDDKLVCTTNDNGK